MLCYLLVVLLSCAAPEANAYENLAGGVIEILEKLSDTLCSKKTQLEEDELDARGGLEAGLPAQGLSGGSSAERPGEVNDPQR